MSKKEDESMKVECEVCGKMISAKMGRALHIKSKFHQDALKRQQEGEKPPETKPPETKPPETKPPETKPPETKEEIKSGIKGGKKESDDKPNKGGLFHEINEWWDDE